MPENEPQLAHFYRPDIWFLDFEFVTGSPRIVAIGAAEDLQLVRVREESFESSNPDALH